MDYPEGPKHNQAHAYKRKAESDFTANRRRRCNQSGRDCGYAAISQGIPPEARRDKDGIAPRASRGNQALVHSCDFWMSDLLNCERMKFHYGNLLGFPGGSDRELGWIPGLGRSPGEGNGNPLWSSCLGNLMDRRAWWATVHGLTKEQDMTEQLTFSLSFSHGNSLQQPQGTNRRPKTKICYISLRESHPPKFHLLIYKLCSGQEMSIWRMEAHLQMMMVQK